MISTMYFAVWERVLLCNNESSFANGFRYFIRSGDFSFLTIHFQLILQYRSSCILKNDKHDFFLRNWEIRSFFSGDLSFLALLSAFWILTKSDGRRYHFLWQFEQVLLDIYANEFKCFDKLSWTSLLSRAT